MSQPIRDFQVLRKRTIKGCLWKLAVRLTLSKDNSGFIEQIISEAERELENAAIPPDWLTEGQVAKEYPLSVKALQQWRHNGRGPAYHKLSNSKNGRVAYKREDIELFLAERRVAPEEKAG